MILPQVVSRNAYLPLKITHGTSIVFCTVWTIKFSVLYVKEILGKICDVLLMSKGGKLFPSPSSDGH